MKVKAELKQRFDKEIWGLVVDYVNTKHVFFSMTGIKYTAKVVGEKVYYRGGRPNSTLAIVGEVVTKGQFLAAYKQIKELEEINTKTVKTYVAQNQSPFVGLLTSAGIIQ